MSAGATNARRRALRGLAGLGAMLLAARLPAADTPAAEGRVIDVEARRFRFTPAEIPLQRGETVTLAIRSLDFVHGFNVPDLGIRTDLVPGRVTRVTLRPMVAGRITFLCDNFCGDGHEDMNGVLVVTG